MNPLTAPAAPDMTGRQSVTSDTLFTSPPATSYNPHVLRSHVAPTMWDRAELNWRDLVRDDARAILQGTVGRSTSRRLWKLMVRLNSRDLYDVRLVEYDRKALDCYLELGADDLDVEQLAAYVRGIIIPAVS